MNWKLYFACFFLQLIILQGTVAADAELEVPGYSSLIQLAVSQRNSGDFASAEANLRQARPLADDTNEVDLLLGMIVAFQERFVEAASIIDSALERYPNDTQLILASARISSYQGIYDEAIETANTVLVLEPESIEARNLLGRVYYYQRAYNQARQSYHEALQRESQNLEALVGIYDVELASGNNETAEAVLLEAEAIDSSHIDVVARRLREIQPISRPHELITNFEVSSFDRSFIDQWYDRALEYRFRADSGNQFYLRGQHSHRFGSHDTLWEAGSRIDRKGSLPLELAVAITDDSDFLPEQRLRIGTQILLNPASESFGSTTLGIAYTGAKYQSGTVDTYRLNFTHYMLGFNGWLTPGLAWVNDENGDTTLGWTLGIHWQINPRLLAGYNYGDAPETENSITTETSSNHVYVRYKLSDAATLRLDLSRNARQRSYTREAAALTLQFRY